MGDWINVEDKLPESFDNVITYREETGSVFPATYINEKFQAISGANGFIPLGGEVTHWMPLPNPPSS